MRRRSFTLLELILVVAILAAMAGAATALVGGVHDQANGEIAVREMHAIRDAVLRFHQDTGWLPGEGPFDLDLPGEGRTGRVAVDGVAVPSQEWFDSAANVSQLVLRPVLLAPSSGLATWDPDRRRGWNGPYLSMSGEGEVAGWEIDGRSGVDPLGAPVSPSPLPPPNDPPPFGPAIADPFLARGGYAWRSHLPPAAALELQGAPYAMLLPRLPGSQAVHRPAARIIGRGPDRALDTADDLAVYLFR